MTTIVNFIFNLFLDLLFNSKEEYNYKSKKFKPAKVVFLTLAGLSFFLNVALYKSLEKTTDKLTAITNRYEELSKHVITPSQTNGLNYKPRKN